MKSYERAQVLYFCMGVINVRIVVVYNGTKMQSVNKCHIFIKEVFSTQTAPHKSAWRPCPYFYIQQNVLRKEALKTNANFTKENRSTL